ncbi:MAG: hypothetical protein EOL95_03625 [Bacteroidia bacterium]|nr:hypothetical protein [Bacteroidia bacterium]
MIYKFILISDEVDGFMREISIDSEAKFSELHNAILDSVGYAKDVITSFFICNDDWEKQQEITLVEMDTSADVDNYVMDETVISEFVSEEEQKLLYVFDYLSDRAFFMQLKEIIPGKDLEIAACTASTGNPPEQYALPNFDDTKKPISSTDAGSIDENFYGDEHFDIEELDEDSFSDMNFDEDFDALK